MTANIRRARGGIWAGLLAVAISLVLNCQPVLAETGTVTIKAPMPTGGITWTAGAVDGILFVGGATTGSCNYPSLLGCGFLEAYNPAKDTWSYMKQMTYPRFEAGGAASGGIFYVVGGFFIDHFTNDFGVRTLEAYDPRLDIWTKKADMPTARFNLGAAAVGGRLYALGGDTGQNARNTILSTVEAYDPATDTWTSRAPMLTSRSGFGVAETGGIIYVFGGATDGAPGPTPTRSVEAYDPSSNSWSTRAPLPPWVSSVGGAAVVDGQIYVLVPEPPYQNLVLAYDPIADRWAFVDVKLSSRALYAVSGVGDSLYVVGGLNTPQWIPLTINEAFTPFLPVAIEINPSTINLKSNGKIKVAILSSSTFDATSVIPDSVKLSGALAATEANGTPLFSFDDVNGDGILDLVLTFRARDLQLTNTDTQAVLKGQTFGGQLIKGVASVRIVPQ